MDELLTVKNVKKYFDKDGQRLQVLRDINLSVLRNEFVAVIGKSRGGKSTLTSILSGFDKPDEGNIIIDGINMSMLNNDELAKLRNEKISVIYDTIRNLDSKASALENVEKYILLSCNKENSKSRSIEFLKLLNFKNTPDTLVGRMLGMERQKVAIAQALALQPVLLLADEPTNIPDEEDPERLFRVFNYCRDKYGLTILMFTQVIDEALKADRIFHLKDGILYELSHTELKNMPPKFPYIK